MEPGTTGQDFPGVGDPRPTDSPWDVLRWPLEPGLRLVGQLIELSPADPDRDARPLFAALDHDAVWRHVANRPGDATDLASQLRHQLSAGRVPWVVRLRRAYVGLEPGTVVGTSSYLDVSPLDARLEIGSTAYLPSVWGTAVNPDAKLQMFTHAFEALGAGRVQLKTDVRNLEWPEVRKALRARL